MADLKHVGRIVGTNRKVLVVFRTLPGESDQCLVVQTENLEDANHDALISLVESPSGQSAYEFAEALARAKFPDGSTMLPSLHAKGRLQKVPTDRVEMIPNFQTSVRLDQLNEIIAEQRGISINDLAIKDTIPKTPDNVEIQEVATVKDITPTDDLTKTTSQAVSEPQVLTDDDLARKYRSDADRLSKEAAQLRRMAEDLVPTKKKSKETTT